MYRYFRVVNSDYILEWKPKGLSDKSIKSPSAAHHFLNPSLNYLGNKTRARLHESYLKQDKITYTHGKIVNTLTLLMKQTKKTTQAVIQRYKIFLFGTVSLTKNVDIDKYKYSGY